MATPSPESRAASWLKLVLDPSTEGLKAMETPYSTQSAPIQAPYDEVITPLASLLQCRLDALSITESLERADSWAALNSCQANWSQLRNKFRTSITRLTGGALAGSLKTEAGDVPFGKVQWDGAYADSATSADSDGDRTMTDDSEAESMGEESEDDDDDDYESDSEDDDGMDESASKAAVCRSEEPPSGPRLPRTRQMHVLHNTVTLCRLARVIANVEQRSAEILAKGFEGATCPRDTKARLLAQLQQVGDGARMSWAQEMKREIEVAEQYRIVMIQVLQDELRR